MKAAELIQEVFFAVRAEAFDLKINDVKRDEDGHIHIYDESLKQDGIDENGKLNIFYASASKPFCIQPAASWMDGDPDVKRCILSYGAGGDVFSHALFGIGAGTIKGKVAKSKAPVGCKKADFSIGTVEEVDVRVFDSKIKVLRHTSGLATTTLQRVHHVLRVKLKNGAVWVIDPAGAQYGQLKPAIPYDEYHRDYVAAILDCRPYGFCKYWNGDYTASRHSKDFANHIFSLMLNQISEHVADELAEWQFHNCSLATIVKAADGEFHRLKAMLLDHATVAAREMVKWVNEDPTTKAKPQPCNLVHQYEYLSEEDKARFDRKRARDPARIKAKQEGR